MFIPVYLEFLTQKLKFSFTSIEQFLFIQSIALFASRRPIIPVYHGSDKF